MHEIITIIPIVVKNLNGIYASLCGIFIEKHLLKKISKSFFDILDIFSDFPNSMSFLVIAPSTDLLINIHNNILETVFKQIFSHC